MSLYVTVVDTPDGMAVSGGDANLCNYKHAKKVADRMNKPLLNIENGLAKAKVAQVCLGNIDDLLEELVPAPLLKGSESEYRDTVQKWMSGLLKEAHTEG